jgi:hypothetical protein
MAAWKRWGLRAALFLAVAGVLGYLSLFLIVKSARFQHWLQAEIANRSGYEFNAGDLTVLPPLRLTASAAIISKSSKPLLQSEKIAVTLSPIGLFSGSIYGLELVKPIVHLNLQELFESPSKTSVNIAIRHLKIQDGTVVLVIGEGESVDFRSINVDAENLNVGETAGLRLSTDLPWLEGRADISIHEQKDEKILSLRIKQPSVKKPGVVSALKESEALVAEIKLRKNESGELEIRGAGQLNQFSIADSNWIGPFTVNADVDAAFKQVTFSAKMVAPALPVNIASVPLVPNKGPITASLTGNFSIPEKQTELKSVRLETAFWTADGSGNLNFSQQPIALKVRFFIRNISLEALKPLLPEWLGAWTYSGVTEADVQVEGHWRALAAHGVARSDGTQFTSPNFSLAQLSLKAPFQWTNGSLQLKDLQLAGKTLAIDRKDQTKISAEEVLVGADFTKTSTDPLKSGGKLEIRRGRFTNSDGSKAGENLTLNARFNVTSTRDNNLVSVAGKVSFEQGEVLWGKFYGDLKTVQPGLDFDGDYTASNDTIRSRRLSLSLANIGSIDLSGKFERGTKTPALNVLVQSGGVNLARFFEFFIREPLKTSHPVFEQFAPGGQVSFAALAQGSTDDLSITGNLQLRAGDLRAKSDKWQVGPINLALPFRIHLPAAKPATTTTNIGLGTLAIASARFGTEAISPVKTRISLRNNILKFEQPVRISIYGGMIDLNNLLWKDFIANPQEFSLSLDAQSLQLQRLTESLDWYRLVGTIGGSIPKVESAGNTLRSYGEIQIQVFGGRIQLSKMEIENPFSNVRSIKLDCRFQDIDLEQASKTFEFGRISGILEGSVTDLVITDGQPAQLLAEVHTVEKSGVSQWISVEALNQLTVLSSGNNAGALYGSLAGLFDNFRYNKLGFRATLKNDKLILRGIESRDGKEYLVVGSRIPPTVNVISYTQEISFGELLNRLKQIQKSGKPQIK